MTPLGTFEPEFLETDSRQEKLSKFFQVWISNRTPIEEAYYNKIIESRAKGKDCDFINAEQLIIEICADEFLDSYTMINSYYIDPKKHYLTAFQDECLNRNIPIYDLKHHFHRRYQISSIQRIWLNRLTLYTYDIAQNYMFYREFGFQRPRVDSITEDYNKFVSALFLNTLREMLMFEPKNHKE